MSAAIEARRAEDWQFNAKLFRTMRVRLQTTRQYLRTSKRNGYSTESAAPLAAIVSTGP